MVKNYKLITVNHKVLNTEDLEHFIVRYDSQVDLTTKLQSIKKSFGQEEVIYLNTCNRVIFLFYGHKDIDQESVGDFFTVVNPDLGDAQLSRLDMIVECYQGADAINHIIEVASSVNSLVVGEREIFRQFREAYRLSKDQHLCGDKMRLVEQSTVKAAKDVYTNTAIGAKPVSVVSLAIKEFLKRELDTRSRVLLIGSGETNSTVGRFLKKHGYRNIIIFNRSLDNAQKLSEELSAEARYLGELRDYSDGFDCIFTCTAAQDPIITSDVYNKIADANDSKLLIDLSIPNNVSREVAQLESVDYISIDSIRSLAEENMKFRSSNISAAKEIISGHVAGFSKLYDRRKVEQALGSLPQEISKVKDRALNLVYKDKIDALPDEAQELIKEIASYMEKKCVAVPMKMAKEMVD